MIFEQPLLAGEDGCGRKTSHDLQKSGEKFGELFFLYYLCPQK